MAGEGSEALGWQEEVAAIGCECLSRQTSACSPHEEVGVRHINIIYIYWYDYHGGRKVTLFSRSLFTG